MATCMASCKSASAAFPAPALRFGVGRRGPRQERAQVLLTSRPAVVPEVGTQADGAVQRVRDGEQVRRPRGQRLPVLHDDPDPARLRILPKLAVGGQRALLLVGANAPWHVSKEVRTGMRGQTYRVKA